MRSILASALLGLCLFQSAGAQVVPTVPDALEGLDPVALVAGSEVPGQSAFTAIHNGFRYMFASADHLAAFKKSPDAYAVQNRGMCSRMGAPVPGNHGLFAVHDGRIYIFGSEECVKAFKGAPAKFLPPDLTPPKTTTAGIAAARLLLDKAAAGFGSSDRVNRVTALRTVASQVQPGRAGGAPGMVTLTTTAVWPQQVRQDMAMGAMAMSIVASGSDGFRTMGTELRPLEEAQRDYIRTEVLRHPLWVVKGRTDPKLQVWPEGLGKVGESVTEDIGAVIRDERIRLSIEPNTGRVLRMAVAGRGPAGEFGEIAVTYSDFRDAGGGVVIAHKEDRTFNGAPIERTPVLQRIEVNPTIDAAFFTRPARR